MKTLKQITESYLVEQQNGDGDCYEVAGRFALNSYGEQFNDYRVVHGVVTGQGHIKGIKYGHAWIEINDSIVIDKSNGNDVIASTQSYYKAGQIKNDKSMKKYTFDEARKHMMKTKHFGPWHDDGTA